MFFSLFLGVGTSVQKFDYGTYVQWACGEDGAGDTKAIGIHLAEAIPLNPDDGSLLMIFSSISLAR